MINYGMVEKLVSDGWDVIIATSDDCYSCFSRSLVKDDFKALAFELMCEIEAGSMRESAEIYSHGKLTYLIELSVFSDKCAGLWVNGRLIRFMGIHTD